MKYTPQARGCVKYGFIYTYIFTHETIFCLGCAIKFYSTPLDGWIIEFKFFFHYKRDLIRLENQLKSTIAGLWDNSWKFIGNKNDL